jgi:hypothetical protein
MSGFGKLFGILVSLAFFGLGFWVLFARRFNYLPRQAKIIFAIFLFLYGGWRLTRYILKNPDGNE